MREQGVAILGHCRAGECHVGIHAAAPVLIVVQVTPAQLCARARPLISKTACV